MSSLIKLVGIANVAVGLAGLVAAGFLGVSVWTTSIFGVALLAGAAMCVAALVMRES